MTKRIKKRALIILIAGLAALQVFETPLPAAAAPQLPLEDIIEGVEKRYSASGFSARFIQTSTLKAMQITETAFGRLFAKRPGMMRWEYEKPERQFVITDGKKLWIYRPDDYQVIVGKAPTYFGEGKGAGFLTDIRVVRENFEIVLDGKSENSNYVLKLVPKMKTHDISRIHLFVSPDTFDVVQVITYNPYEDETRIELIAYEHTNSLTDSLFKFNIPQGVDIVKMDE